jgi:hypothetical protein
MLSNILINVATFLQNIDKKWLTEPTFLKMLEEAKRNVNYKNIGPENVASFCKMLTKNYYKC